jgi:hypothetical protein
LKVTTQFKRIAQLPVKIPFAVAYTGNIHAGTFAAKNDLGVFKGVLQAYVQRKSGSPLYSLALP